MRLLHTPVVVSELAVEANHAESHQSQYASTETEYSHPS